MPSAIAIFCDDIRQEIGNKVSFAGIYQQSYLSPSPFPLTIQKLCVALFYAHYVSEEHEPVFFRVKLSDNDTPIFETELPVDKMIEIAPTVTVAGGHVATLMTRFDLTISPLVVAQAATIEVQVFKGKDLKLEAGSLEILSTAEQK